MSSSEPQLPSHPAPDPPREAPVEEVRLRRNVRAQLFGGIPEPTRVGRYRLLQCIGRGGMGVVWSAHDDELDRTVAIKLLRPELSAGDLTAEARALARLSHPNVVSVFDVGRHDAQDFIAMEFVEGETMRAWLSRAQAPAEILNVLCAAGRGLAAAHEVGLVHRDFKPDNVLVGRDGRPRVLDFGLARPPEGGLEAPPEVPLDADPMATTLTQAGLLVGTPAYMAPEQHLGESADARSDQFAFAVSSYEALTGRLPFQGDDLRTLSLAIVRGRVPTSPSLPPAVFEVLQRALAPEPERRYPGMGALLDALDQAKAHADEAPAPDPRFDTRQVDRVLSRAAALQADSGGRPGLSATELEAVAAEAGIDPAHARRAVAEEVAPPPVPTPTPPAQLVPLSPPETGEPELPRRWRLPTFDFVVEYRALSRPVSPVVSELLLREMQRRGGTGKIQRLGASTTWQNRNLELHIDAAGSHTTLSLREKMGLAARVRTEAVMVAFTIFCLALVIPATVELLSDSGIEFLIPVFVFSTIGGGLYWGRRLSHALHTRERKRLSAELEHTVKRLDAIAHTNEGLQGDVRMLHPLSE